MAYESYLNSLYRLTFCPKQKIIYSIPSACASSVWEVAVRLCLNCPIRGDSLLGELSGQEFGYGYRVLGSGSLFPPSTQQKFIGGVTPDMRFILHNPGFLQAKQLQLLHIVIRWRDFIVHLSHRHLSNTYLVTNTWPGSLIDYITYLAI